MTTDANVQADGWLEGARKKLCAAALAPKAATLPAKADATPRRNDPVVARAESSPGAAPAVRAVLPIVTFGNIRLLVSGDGKVTDRAQAIANEKATKYTVAKIEDLKVTAFGDTAIARVLLTYKGTDPRGKALDAQSRWTDTWVKMPDGKWQCVASHGSNVKK